MYEGETEDIIKAQNKSEEALARVIEANSGLIWSAVQRFSGRGHAMEDLYQIGCIGLIKAIQRFDTSYNVRISTYAVPYIIGEIKRFIRDDGIIKVSRSIKELCVKIKDIENRKIKEGKNVTIEEIAKELKVDKEEIILALDSMKQVESIFVESNDDKNNTTLLDKLSNDKNEEEEVVNEISIKDMLRKMEKRDKEIILLRYFKGKTQSEVAKILNISQVQVSRLEKKILNNMKLELSS